jgi:hypothetical protein
MTTGVQIGAAAWNAVINAWDSPGAMKEMAAPVAGGEGALGLRLDGAAAASLDQNAEAQIAAG